MSLDEALRDLIEARGWGTPDTVAHVAGSRNTATFYRLLSGATRDPRISTLLEVCRALAISPNDLLHLAGLLCPQGQPLELIDVQLRQAFAELQGLNEDDKRLCLALLRSIISLRGRRQKGRARRRSRGTA